MDKGLLGWNFPIDITIVNEIDQKRVYTIMIDTLAPIEIGDEGEDVTEDGNGIVIEGLSLIEAIEIEFAHVDIKGLLTISFEKYVLTSAKNDTDESLRRLSASDSEL